MRHIPFISGALGVVLATSLALAQSPAPSAAAAAPARPAPAAASAAASATAPANLPRYLLDATIDPKARTLAWVNAGHNAPIRVRRGREPEELGPTGPVLGVIPGFAYRRQGPMALEPGDAVFLFTDGLVEARDRGSNLYGEERLTASLHAHALAHPDASGILSGVLTDLATFVGTRPMDDDLTCMVLRVTAEEAGR